MSTSATLTPPTSTTDQLRYPRRLAVSLPHPLVSLCAVIGALVALWPAGLPRPVAISGPLTAACVGIMTIVGSVAARRRSSRPPADVAALAAAAGTLLCLGLLSMAWQNGVRTDLALPHVGIVWPVATVVPAMVVFGAIVFTPRATALIGATAIALLAGLLPAAHADDSPSAPREAPAGVLYAPADSSTIERRSGELARRWASDGGLDRSAVVIAVPTGSGWVDDAAVTGFVGRFAGDVTVLAVQYANSPSWQAFVGDRSAAGRSAIALLDHVVDLVDGRPVGRRPRIYLYGQSLGAVGAEDARAWAKRHHPGAVDGTVLAGVPDGTIGRGDSAGPPRSIVANPSDPVPRWSLSLLWRPARMPAGTVVTGRAVRQPPWFPVASFVQTSADLLTSLDGPIGVGHRYGTEQAGTWDPHR